MGELGGVGEVSWGSWGGCQLGELGGVVEELGQLELGQLEGPHGFPPTRAHARPSNYLLLVFLLQLESGGGVGGSWKDLESGGGVGGSWKDSESGGGVGGSWGQLGAVGRTVRLPWGSEVGLLHFS